MAFARVTIDFEDDVGKDAKVAVLVDAADADPAGAAIQDLKTTMQACTNAGAYRSESGTQSAGPGGSLGTGQTPNVEDRATFTFRTSVNGTITYEIPGPISAIFMSTNEDQVDRSNALVIAYATKMIAGAKDRYGNALTSLVKGQRIRKKQMKV